MMKKKVLSLFAVVAFAVALMAGSAWAVVDLDAGTGTSTFATEIDIDGTTGTALANSGNIMDTTANAGFGAAAGETRYIRFDLSNGAEFVANPTYELDGVDGTLSAGGAGESYVIYSWTSSDGTVSDDKGTLTITTDGVTVYNESPVTITYSMYQTAADAVNQANALATSSATLLKFGPALTTEVGTVTPDKIDVTQGSTYFDGGPKDDETEIGKVTIEVDGKTLWIDGQQAEIDDIVAEGTQLVISGDFTACQDLTDGVPNGTYTASKIKFNGADGTALDGTSATYTTNNIFNGSIVMTVNGVSQIAKGSYTAVYKIIPAPGSDASDISLGTLSTLEKNGSTRDVYNIPASTNSDQAYIRIYNTSSVTGTVYGTLRDEDGNLVGSANTVLVSDMAPGTTKVFSAADLETLFGGTWTRRARMTIDGEIPSMEVQALIRSATGTITNMSPIAP